MVKGAIFWCRHVWHWCQNRGFSMQGFQEVLLHGIYLPWGDKILCYVVCVWEWLRLRPQSSGKCVHKRVVKGSSQTHSDSCGPLSLLILSLLIILPQSSAEFLSHMLKLPRPSLLLLHFPKNPQHRQSGIFMEIALQKSKWSKKLYQIALFWGIWVWVFFPGSWKWSYCLQPPSPSVRIGSD